MALLRVLLSQYHVAFATLWPVVSECLAKLAEKDKDGTWPVIVGSMQKISKDFNRLMKDSQGDSPARVEEEEEDDNAKIRLRDLVATKERTADVATAHSSLWKMLASIPLLVEAKSKEWVDMFEEFIMGSHHEYFFGTSIDNDDGEDVKNDSRQGRKSARKRLLDYLELFGLFKSPSALKKADWIHDLLMQMLSHSDQAIQLNALKSILKWKSPSLTPYCENLEKLLDGKKSRDTLAHFTLEPGPIHSTYAHNRHPYLSLLHNHVTQACCEE